MKKILNLILFFSPIITLAAFDGVKGLIGDVQGIVESLVPIAFSLAFLAFFWGLALFIFKAGSPEAKEEGKRIMIWGVIALFVITAIGGIIAVLGQTLGISTGGSSGGIGPVGGESCTTSADCSTAYPNCIGGYCQE